MIVDVLTQQAPKIDGRATEKVAEERVLWKLVKLILYVTLVIN